MHVHQRRWKFILHGLGTYYCLRLELRRKVFEQKRRCREVKMSKIAIYTDALQWFYLSTAHVGKM